MKNFAKLCMVIFMTTCTLQGCIFVAGAAAGAAAITIVYDHRTISNSFKDTKIANAISRKITVMTGEKTESHIQVTVFNGTVLLTGETPSKELHDDAEKYAQHTAGVTRVYNQISLEGPTSTLTRTSDYWITTKIKAQMLAKENLKSSSIKVVTENGVVYLMGIVTRAQADIAADIARRVTGVQKVVKIFQYTEAPVVKEGASAANVADQSH